MTQSPGTIIRRRIRVAKQRPDGTLEVSLGWVEGPKRDVMRKWKEKRK